MYDMKIVDGLIIDGTGSPRYAGDVGIRDGRIVDLGSAPDSAKRTINAAGRVVSPGFVDIHTHYDAQVFWDPLLTVSPWHGVTTAVMGNCGFTLAPTRREHRDLIMRTFERVEAISLPALEQSLGREWPFSTYPEYLDVVERNGLGINAASLIGHTAVRLNVMGLDSVERAATEEEIAAMKGLVAEGLRAGAIGFSTSTAKAHHGFDGKPVPSRLSTPEERIALASTIREVGKGMVMMVGQSDPRPWDEYIDLARASGAPVCWSVIQGTPGRYPAELAITRELVSAGLKIYPQAACRPVLFEYHFGEPVGLMATWPLLSPILRLKTVRDKIALLADPEFRRRFREAIDGRNDTDLGVSADDAALRRRGFGMTEIAWYPPDRSLEGLSAQEVAKRQGRHVVDLVLDMSCDTSLEARFRTPQANLEEEHLGAVLADPNVVLGLGDGGAHLAQLCDAVYATHFLGHWVRKKKLVSLEHAVHRLTMHPASVFGIKDRGRLATGRPADIVIFDPEHVGCGPLKRVYDLPAGSDRMISKPTGIDAVIVNGHVLPAPGEAFDKAEPLPGKLLRHGNAAG